MDLRPPEQIYAMVRCIPRGSVTSYGALGRALQNPVSGLVVGSWMSRCPEDVPWWRVVASDGRLVVAKRGPGFEEIQRARLEEEGVPFDGDRVSRSANWVTPAH